MPDAVLTSPAPPAAETASARPARPQAVAGRATGRERLVAGLASLACAGVLGIGAWLEPATPGHGTHTQLGLPPCGWATVLGFPCPTCGMTTSFAHAADGNLAASFSAQPAGCLMAVATAIGFWCTLHVAVTGSRLGGPAAALLRPRSMWVVAGLCLAAWAYKAAVWTPV